jgi:hypothetical protein
VSLGAPKMGNVGKSSSFGYSLGPLISWTFPNFAVARAEQTKPGGCSTSAGALGHVQWEEDVLAASAHLEEGNLQIGDMRKRS